MTQYYSFESNQKISEALNQLLNTLSAKADPTQPFTMAVSGGSLPSLLGACLQNNKNTSNWHVFFADERCVPLNSSDSNYLACQESFLQKWPGVNVHTIQENLIEDPEKAAIAYQKEMELIFQEKLPVFDVIFLGMGPDGHTCSLFPGHSLLNETNKWIASLTDSPKPPPCRITLTFPVLNAAKLIVFVVTGASKANVLHEMLDLGKDYPANRGNYWIIIIFN